MKTGWDRELAASDWASTTTEEGGVWTYEKSGESGESFVLRAEESEIEDAAFDEEDDEDEEDDDDSETDDEQDEGGSHEQGQKRKRDSKMDDERDEDGPQG